MKTKPRVFYCWLRQLWAVSTNGDRYHSDDIPHYHHWHNALDEANYIARLIGKPTWEYGEGQPIETVEGVHEREGYGESI